MNSLFYYSQHMRMVERTRWNGAENDFTLHATLLRRYCVPWYMTGITVIRSRTYCTWLIQILFFSFSFSISVLFGLLVIGLLAERLCCDIFTMWDCSKAEKQVERCSLCFCTAAANVTERWKARMSTQMWCGISALHTAGSCSSILRTRDHSGSLFCKAKVSL